MKNKENSIGMMEEQGKSFVALWDSDKKHHRERSDNVLENEELKIRVILWEKSEDFSFSRCIPFGNKLNLIVPY